MPYSEAPAVWVLADDRTGDVAQCMGVAEALGWPFAVKSIAYERLGILHNVLRGPTLVGVSPDSRAGLAPPWPRLVIGCGRRTVPIARWIKRRSGCFLTQIMDPGIGSRADIDLLAVPSHDACRLPEARAVRILGAPHRVTPRRLAAAAAHWRPHLAHLPRPWLAVIVGGATRRRDFPQDLARQLGRDVSAMASAAGGSVLLTTSRRTGRAAERILLSAIEPPRYIHRWGQGGDNPFMAMIALADAVVVTGESTSMCTEATLCRGPVHIWSPSGWAAPKRVRLHRDLFVGGYARPFEDWTGFAADGHAPLNPAAAIAAAIRERLR